MLDAPGPWGSGPFTLVEGHSSIDNEFVKIPDRPDAGIWLQTRDDRTPQVRLAANPHYWNTSRGPRLQEVVFRNDLSPEQALGLVCDTEGEVDILTELSPTDAARVQASEHARLVSIDALRTLAGVINRDVADLPLADRRARLALNLAIDRKRLIREAMAGHADLLAGLTPPSANSKLSSHPQDAARAVELWRSAGGPGRALRIVAPAKWESVARVVGAQLGVTLCNGAVVTVLSADEERQFRRRLAERSGPADWDVFIHEIGPQAADAPPLELHRAFVGEAGEFRAGPVLPEFDKLYQEFARQTAVPAQMAMAARIDRFVYDEALALFLCAPHALYAVNRDVRFVPYRTTFELAECEVDGGHWSRRT